MSARWTRTVPPGCQAIGSEQLCPARVRQLGDASSGAASKRREVPRINTPRAARRLPVRGRRRNTPMRATCLRTNGFVGRTDPGEEFSPNGTSYARQPGSVPCHARRSWPVGPLTRMRLCGHLALAARSSCCGLRLVRGPRFFAHLLAQLLAWPCRWVYRFRRRPRISSTSPSGVPTRRAISVVSRPWSDSR